MARGIDLFLDGLGIIGRRWRYAEAWNDHLSRSKELQVNWLSKHKKKFTTGIILGSGFLFDCALDPLSEVTSEIQLVDGNPLTKVGPASWHKKNPACKIAQIQAEIAPMVNDWHLALMSELESIAPTDDQTKWIRALEIVREIPEHRNNKVEIKGVKPQSDWILSLNILSQLPLAWQGLVESELRALFGDNFLRRQEQLWLNSLQFGHQVIIKEHFKYLATSKAREIMILCDLSFADYFEDGDLVSMQSPLKWFPDNSGQYGSGNWGAEGDRDISKIELVDPMHGLSLNNLCDEFFSSDWSVKFHDPWLWHLRPGNKGAVHLVGAIELSRLLPT